MICKKIQHLLSEAKLKGFNFIEIETLTEFQLQDLKECGYNIKFINQMFKISL